MGQIRAMQQTVYDNAVAKGFHDNPRTLGDALMLIVTEAAEAMEDVRHGKLTTVLEAPDHKPEGFPSEIADIVIRCMDLAGQAGFDLESEIRMKMGYNETRPHRHGGKAL